MSVEKELLLILLKLLGLLMIVILSGGVGLLLFLVPDDEINENLEKTAIVDLPPERMTTLEERVEMLELKVTEVWKRVALLENILVSVEDGSVTGIENLTRFDDLEASIASIEMRLERSNAERSEKSPSRAIFINSQPPI